MSYVYSVHINMDSVLRKKTNTLEWTIVDVSLHYKVGSFYAKIKKKIAADTITFVKRREKSEYD